MACIRRIAGAQGLFLDDDERWWITVFRARERDAPSEILDLVTESDAAANKFIYSLCKLSRRIGWHLARPCIAQRRIYTIPTTARVRAFLFTVILLFESFVDVLQSSAWVGTSDSEYINKFNCDLILLPRLRNTQQSQRHFYPGSWKQFLRIFTYSICSAKIHKHFSLFLKYESN